MRTWLFILGIVVLAGCFAGCKSTYNVKRVSPGNVAREDTIVFVRPTEYHIFGSTSMRDYIEIMHENAARNEAGLLTVQVGIRNTGGQHFWDTRGPDFTLSMKTAFFDQSFSAPGDQSSVPVYETNWETATLLRGATHEYKVICPKKSAGYYQVTISEVIK